MNIGLLGGSFNPFHNGHLQIALLAKENVKLDQVWILPTGNHPFKHTSMYLSYHKRYKLIEKAIQDYSELQVKHFDAYQGKYNYTEDLVKRLENQFPEHTFYFIIGDDNLNELTLWHNYMWLMENVKFIILKRGSTTVTQLPSQCFFIELQPIPISSTLIRKKVVNRQPIDDLVSKNTIEMVKKYYKKEKNEMKEIRSDKAPEPVGAYSQAIQKNGLIFVSGQIGINPETNLLEDGFIEQTNQIFSNLEAILAEAESDFKEVVKVTIFLKDMSQFFDLNNLYQRYFSYPFPAREVVEVSELPKAAELEISIIAIKEKK